MKAFKGSIVDGVIVCPIELHQYMQELAHSDAVMTRALLPIHDGHLKFTMETLMEAQHSLSEDKAQGLDKIKDVWLHDEEIWSNIDNKVLEEFNFYY